MLAFQQSHEGRSPGNVLQFFLAHEKRYQEIQVTSLSEKL